MCILARAQSREPFEQLTNLAEARADGANDRTELAKGESPLLGIIVNVRHDGGQRNVILENLENDRHAGRISAMRRRVCNRYS